MNNTLKYNFAGNGCPLIAPEELNITVPVIVRASSDVGSVEIRCLSSTINRNSDYTPGEINATSSFTVSQRMHVDIPLMFNAEVEVGEGHVEFLSSDNPC